MNPVFNLVEQTTSSNPHTYVFRTLLMCNELPTPLPDEMRDIIAGYDIETDLIAPLLYVNIKPNITTPEAFIDAMFSYVKHAVDDAPMSNRLVGSVLQNLSDLLFIDKVFDFGKPLTKDHEDYYSNKWSDFNRSLGELAYAYRPTYSTERVFIPWRGNIWGSERASSVNTREIPLPTADATPEPYLAMLLDELQINPQTKSDWQAISNVIEMASSVSIADYKSRFDAIKKYINERISSYSEPKSPHQNRSFTISNQAYMGTPTLQRTYMVHGYTLKLNGSQICVTLPLDSFNRNGEPIAVPDKLSRKIIPTLISFMENFWSVDLKQYGDKLPDYIEFTHEGCGEVEKAIQQTAAEQDDEDTMLFSS